MEIKKENLLAVLKTAPENVKEILFGLFPEIKEEEAQQAAKCPVEERIKTFDDACRELGENHPFVRAYNGYSKNISEENKNDVDVLAFLKLRIICDALNEGWEPQFTEDEWRWYPWFYLYTEEELSNKSEEWKTYHALKMLRPHHPSGYDGLAFAHSAYAPSNTTTNFGSSLCLKSEALATYCGSQFIDVWADFILIYH